MATIRVSPISRTAAILIVVIGVFTLLVGIGSGYVINEVAGGAFIALGLVLYWLLIWFTRKVQREILEVQES